jgi:hypothetical protein
MASLPPQSSLLLRYHSDSKSSLVCHWFVFTAVISGVTRFHSREANGGNFHRSHYCEYYSTPYPLLHWRCSTAAVAATTAAASGPDSPTVTKVDVGGLDPPPLPVPGAVV